MLLIQRVWIGGESELFRIEGDVGLVSADHRHDAAA